jgi:hypothetical protein
MDQFVQILLAAHGTPLAIATWLAVVLLCIFTVHALVKLLREAVALRNEWKTRVR